MSRETRWWFGVAMLGWCAITGALTCFDEVLVGPPDGIMRVVLWPAEVLLWASTPPRDAAFANGKFEWTPVQDLALWIGSGAAWAFWLLVAWTLGQLGRRTIQ